MLTTCRYSDEFCLFSHDLCLRLLRMLIQRSRAPNSSIFVVERHSTPLPNRRKLCMIFRFCSLLLLLHYTTQRLRYSRRIRLPRRARIFFLSNLFDALRFICFPWFLSDTIDGIPQNFSCLLIIHGSKKCSSVTPRRFPILVGINNLEALMRYTLCVRCCERKFGNHWFQYIEIETISHKKMLRIRNEVLRFPQLCFKYYNDPRCLILVLKLKALLQLPAHLFEIIIKLLKHLHIERFGGFTSLSKVRFRGIFRQDPQLMYTFTNESSRWMFIWIKIFLSPLCYHQLESTFVSGRSKKGRIARDEEEFKKCIV